MTEYATEEEECVALCQQIIKTKVQVAILNRKKRLLVEEIHRQFLEGELDPKKRLKTVSVKAKKSKTV